MAINYRLVDKEVTVAKLVTIKVLGETGAVRASVEAGVAAAERVGTVFSSHVIPSPHEDMAELLLVSEGGGRDEAKPSDFESMTVAELRRRVRALETSGLSGRDISRASKDALIEMLRRATSGE